MCEDADQLVANAIAALDRKLRRDGLPTFRSTGMLVANAMLRLSGSEVERLLLYSLDRDLRLLAVDEVAVGTEGECIFSMRILARLAIVAGADSVALVHCHPSGDVYPSDQDKLTAARVDQFMAALGILCCHFVVTGHSFANVRTGFVADSRSLAPSEDIFCYTGPLCPHCAGRLDRDVIHYVAESPCAS